MDTTESTGGYAPARQSGIDSDDQRDSDPVTDGGRRELTSGVRAKLHEGFHEHGEVRCSGCGNAVDFSDGDTLADAVEIWNAHARSCNGIDGDDDDDPDPVTDGGPDHDVPVSEQLTDRQRELIEDDGGADDA